jgi:hypothetical protein
MVERVVARRFEKFCLLILYIIVAVRLGLFSLALER